MATSEQLKMAGDIFKWRSTFDRFDADGSGFVDGAVSRLVLVSSPAFWRPPFCLMVLLNCWPSGDELMDMVKELVGDIEVGSTQVEALMKELDESSDGEVSWEEFLTVMQRMHRE